MMTKKDIKAITKIAKSMDWTVEALEEDGKTYFELETYSDKWQHLTLTIWGETVDEFADNLNERYCDYDCSEEAYIWLDDFGHGKNGAPYDMRDVYEDMETCYWRIGLLSEAVFVHLQNACA